MPNIALDSTPQQVADFVVAHLHKQGRPAQAGLDCVYRKSLPDGTCLMCAVGVLLTDEEYIATWNSALLTDLMREWRRRRQDVSISFYKKHNVLLSQLQQIHDQWRASNTEGGTSTVESEKCTFKFSDLIPHLQRLYTFHGLTLPEVLKLD